MEKEIKIYSACEYAGHSINNAGIVNLNLVFDFSELQNVILMMQLLNEDIEVFCKINADTKKIGNFGIKDIKINSNGESKIKLSSLIQSVDVSAINDLIERDNIKIAFKANINVNNL